MSMRKKQGSGELVSGDGCTYHMGYWQKIKPELGLSFYLICQGYSLAVIVDSVIYRNFGVILSYRLLGKLGALLRRRVRYNVYNICYRD